MTVALKSYPHYKSSGVRWLGDVPMHWDVLPNRVPFVEVNDRKPPAGTDAFCNDW